MKKSPFNAASYKPGESIEVDIGAIVGSHSPQGQYRSAKVINPSNSAGQVYVNPSGGSPMWVWLAWTRRKS